MLIHLHRIRQTQANVPSIPMKENERWDSSSLRTRLKNQPCMNGNTITAHNRMIFMEKIVFLGAAISARILAGSTGDSTDFWREEESVSVRGQCIQYMFDDGCATTTTTTTTTTNSSSTVLIYWSTVLSCAHNTHLDGREVNLASSTRIPPQWTLTQQLLFPVATKREWRSLAWQCRRDYPTWLLSCVCIFSMEWIRWVWHTDSTVQYAYLYRDGNEMPKRPTGTSR